MGELDKIIATYGFTRGDGKTSIVIAGGPKMVGHLRDIIVEPRATAT